MTYQPPHLAVVTFLKGLGNTELDKFVDQDTSYGRWIFRDGLPVGIARTGKRAIVVRSSPGANPTTHDVGAMVSCSLYADHTRDVDGQAALEDGIDRAWAMFGYLDQHLHNPKPLLDGAVVLQSDRAAQPLESFDRDQDCAYLAVTYDVTMHAQV